MKIVSYNISDSKPWKIERLLGMDADVWVVPEITCPEDARLPENLSMEWKGIHYQYRNTPKWKGLGLIWKKGQGEIPEWYNPEMNYGIPLIIGDYLILGIWPTKKLKTEEKKLYPQIAQEIILEYAPYFKDYKTLVVGDFNCYVNQRDNSKKYGDILRINEILESYGLHSIYHRQTGEAFGHETQLTYFHQFHEDDPYFLDYAYTNMTSSSIRLFPWDKQMSDHVGLEVILDVVDDDKVNDLSERRECYIKPRKCPVCGAPVYKILYGLPAMSEKDYYQKYHKHFIYGGCGVTGDDPYWACSECGLSFYKKIKVFERLQRFAEKRLVKYILSD